MNWLIAYALAGIVWLLIVAVCAGLVEDSPEEAWKAIAGAFLTLPVWPVTVALMAGAMLRSRRHP